MKRANIKPGQLVEVHWNDPCVSSHWRDSDDITICKRFCSRSVGWIHLVDDFGCVLTASQEVDGEKQLLLCQHLPWDCIENLWILEVED